MILIHQRMGSSRFRTALCALIFLAVPGAALAQTPSAPARLETCIRQKADAEDFSGVVSAVEHGRSLALVARGGRGGPDSTPITPDTRFNIGSASKMFTAVAIGQLIDSGKLKLDDPVGRYVSGLTAEASAVTIRQLLTHTSGMGNFFKPENFKTMEKARSASDILPLIAGDRPEFAPGDHFEYSNSGFALLGIVIERVSGETYGQYLEQNVFARAGMSNSGVDPEPITTLAVGMTSMQLEMASPLGGGAPGVHLSQVDPEPGSAGAGASGLVLMRPHGEGIQPPPGASAEAGAGMVLIGPHGERISPPAAGGPLHPAPGATVYGTPAGGVFSSAVDMQKFMAALIANRLTSPETTAALTTIRVTPRGNPPGSGYGLGFGIRPERGRDWVGHNGGALGANSEIFLDKSTGLSVAVITNRDPPSATRMFSYVKDLLAEPALAESCGIAGEAKRAPAVGGPPRMKVLKGAASIPDVVTGSGASMPMTLIAGVPTIAIEINGQGPFRLAFDTGAPGGPHLSDHLASKLGLQSSGQMLVGDPSGKNPTPVKLYRLESVSFGAVSAKGWAATAAPALPGKAGAFDGVVGLGAFAGYVVTIDYPNHRFSLRRDALPPADGRSVFSYQGQMAPAVPLTIEDRTILAHVDTGNSVVGVIVPAEFAQSLRHGSKAKLAGQAHTVSSTVQMYSVAIDGRACVGTTPLSASTVQFPTIIPVANIGSLALANTVVQVDPSHERIRLSSAM